MGRGRKRVQERNGELDRRETGYYSTPSFVAEFLAQEALRHVPNARRLLDPCVGREELLAPFLNTTIELDSIDILDFRKQSSKSTFLQADFLRWYWDRKTAGAIEANYDIYVANPPYNCHEVAYMRDNRSWLREAFAEIGTDNICGLFLSALIEIAKPGAIIAAICLDSFLTGRVHEGLRRKIRRECSIHTLLLCPQDLFRGQGADVRSCVLVLQKGQQYQGAVRVLDRVAATGQFIEALGAGRFETRELDELIQGDQRDRSELVVGLLGSAKGLFSGPRIGEAFDCVTGISTGNDVKYLRRAPQGAHRIAFYKNPASRRFFMNPDAYLPEDFLQLAQSVPNFIVRNRAFLNREGLSCSSMGVKFGACFLPSGACFGVNPNIFPRSKRANDALWLLAYLNSSLVSYLVRKGIIRTNMITSGYAARIPLPNLGRKVCGKLGLIAQEAIATGRSQGHERSIERIDRMIFDELGIGEGRGHIVEFVQNMVELT